MASQEARVGAGGALSGIADVSVDSVGSFAVADSSVAADVAWPVYFGRRHLGSIRSVGFAVGVFGAALGPLPFGLAYDFLGGYRPAILGLLILPVLATVAVLLARPPRLAE